MGHTIDWAGFAGDFAGRKISVPTYPFQRERYWLEPVGFGGQGGLAIPGPQVHPLLGRRVHSAAAGDLVQFESQMSAEKPGYLTDHRIFGTPVFPGMGFLEMAAAAGRHLHPGGQVVVEDVVLHRAITLPGDEVRITQVVLEPDGSRHNVTRSYSCDLFSRPFLPGQTGPNADQQDTPHWTRHAKGRVAVSAEDDDAVSCGVAASVGLDELKNRCDKRASADDIYERLSREALHYGPYFQGMKALWLGKDKEVLGQVELPEANQQDAEEYLLHPALLDSCLHVMAGVVADDANLREGRPPFLPVGIKRLRVFCPAGLKVFSHAKIHAEGPIRDADSFTADLHLFRPDGRPVAALEGLSMRRVPHFTLLGKEKATASDWSYEVAWREVPAGDTASLTAAGGWLLLADAGGVAEQLAERLSQHGCSAALAWPGDRYEVLPPSVLGQIGGRVRQYRIRPDCPEDYNRLLEEAFDPDGGRKPGVTSLTGVLHLWNLGVVDDQADAFSSSHRLGCGSALQLVQALASGGQVARLWLVTRGSQAVGQTQGDVAQLAQAPLLGLGRVISLEHSELKCVCVDLDPEADLATQAEALLAEMADPDDENQIAYRNRTRHAARLERMEDVPRSALSIPDGPYRLRLTGFGAMDNLAAVPMERRAPGPAEVEIEVAAAGLNFRDVLRALGMLEEFEREVGKRLGISSPLEAPLGFECAGKVVAVGEGVEHVSAGDEVVAIAYGSLASHVTANAGWVTRKPESLDMVQAASLPMAFVTAVYALEHLAKLRQGERVLIHAAGGGVGQAAVQVARSAGAEVYGTASPVKWEFLKSQGVRQVMNSRTLQFQEELRKTTGGQGVDVVLNSLSGEFIAASLATLGRQGRFVEIGQLEIWDAPQMAAQRPDVAYFPFNLDDEEARRPGLIQSILAELMPRFDSGELEPPPHRVFPVTHVPEALKYLSQTQRIGKVVVAIAPLVHKHLGQIEASCPPAGEIREDATYLITGGLGGLGLRVARWLVDEGARHIVLCGRRGPNTREQSKAIQSLQQAKAEVSVITADVSRREDVEQLVDTIRRTHPPLRGVVHAAGVLDDGMLRLQDWSRFERVMRPKVAGAWHLHRLTENLDFFAVFSSGVGLVGAHGQGNYAAANAFLDALAHYRRAMGQPAVSIAWGPWNQLGMTADMDQPARDRMAEIGLQPIDPDEAVMMFGRLIHGTSPHVAAMHVDWRRLAGTFSPPPLWAELAKASSAPQGPSAVLEELRRAPATDRMQRLVEHLRSEVAAVLGWNGSEQVGPRQKLFDLGMDSLTSVELRHRLEASLSCPLPLTVAFDYPSVEALAEFIAEELGLLAEEPVPEIDDTEQMDAEQIDPEAKRLEEMSDEEVEALMAEKFKDLL